MLCPCGRPLAFDACCSPLIQGWHTAKTAEDLMRSRYAAYATGAVDYLVDTQDPAKPASREGIESWVKRARFTGLEITATEGGGEADSEGVVEFAARYLEGGAERLHLERSLFRKVDGRWLYLEAGVPVRKSKAPGRNEPCPCGSGKKYKKCCGA